MTKQNQERINEYLAKVGVETVILLISGVVIVGVVFSIDTLVRGKVSAERLYT